MKYPHWSRLLAAVLFAVVANLSWAQPPIDLNSATVEQLTALRGIGPSKAQAIVQYRTEHGAFTSIEQLLEVKGVGRSILTKNEGMLQLGQQSNAQ
ncbi:ComEA family DNA-binding protein [Marinobacterium arenosum]|uniref:ComEA family DNA-binding protein n=1 Tax=Marinobacterium arenosum TaxID=2862496 RepID=UPI001C966C71|nr:helix-hairpin-helix domain-containing protein [Marinobacterium arenosum]MBY4676022.1 helix-hairpin-helix domain-containing protein [Marinobacterium arenosum]